jgi:hypothetical protein
MLRLGISKLCRCWGAGCWWLNPGKLSSRRKQWSTCTHPFTKDSVHLSIASKDSICHLYSPKRTPPDRKVRPPERVYGRANKASNAGCVGNPTLRSPQSLSSDLGERWDDWRRRRRCSKVRSPSHPRTTRETVALHCVEYLYGDFQLDLREAKQGVLADCGAAQ